MTRLALVACLLVVLATPADAKPNDRADCAIEDKRVWVPLGQPPADASALRALADTAPSFSVPQRWAAETWFTLAGETLLCRSDAPLTRACAGEWWRFVAGKLVAHDSWLCLAR